MITRTPWGRALAVWMAIGVSQVAVPVVRGDTLPAPGRSSDHLVAQGQVARRLLEDARTRAQRIKLFQDALGTEEARKQARALGADPDRLRAAVPHLTDRELADLSTRAAQVKDVAAGHGGNGTAALVLVGVLLLVAGIAVLAAVADDDYYDDWDDCYCY